MEKKYFRESMEDWEYYEFYVGEMTYIYMNGSICININSHSFEDFNDDEDDFRKAKSLVKDVLEDAEVEGYIYGQDYNYMFVDIELPENEGITQEHFEKLTNGFRRIDDELFKLASPQD